MFSEMVSEIASGIMPDTGLLRKRFDLALTKKLGVVKTPYPLWTADKKINPAAKELLWAAIILEDRDSYLLINSIIAAETAEKRKTAGRLDVPESGLVLTETILDELRRMAPSEEFLVLLERKITKTTG